MVTNFSWESNGDRVVEILIQYFGLDREQVLSSIRQNFRTEYDKQRLVAMVGALSSVCRQGQPARVGDCPQENLNDRIKSGEAILSNPSFSDSETPSDIYYRLRNLYTSIASKGIDIYKTIYVSSLTDGNLGVIYDPRTNTISRYSNSDRDFENVYGRLQEVLRLSQEDANAIVEKCAATFLSKVSASNIPAMYQAMLNFTMYCPDDMKYYYFFRHDRQSEGLERKYQKSKSIDEGLSNCPTIFACKADKVTEAFKYVVSKIPKHLIEQEYLTCQQAGKTTMTHFWCAYQITRRWINNNFSLLTINVDRMQQREEILRQVARALNFRENANRDAYYDFGFLFQRPASISTMNAITVEGLERNARRNVITLEKYTSPQGVVDYISRNHYVLAMENDKLEKLLSIIRLHDEQDPSQPYMDRFFMLGKSLFGNKHCINFNIEPTFKKLAQVEDIQILDVEKMDDWERVSKFVELFCGNDQKFVIKLQRLAFEKAQKDGRGNAELRKQIRTLLTRNGGWDAIIKDRRRIKEVTAEVESIYDKRFTVEQVERTGEAYDIALLQAKEDGFADEIKRSLTRIRSAYSLNRDRLNKLYTDVDKLYEYTITFLTEKCFDDKEPITVLMEEELRAPLFETFKAVDGAHIDPQQSLWGAQTIIVPAPEQTYSPLKTLTKKISADTAVDKNMFQVVKSTDEGK